MTTTEQIHAEALKIAETPSICRIIALADIERILEAGRLIGLEQEHRKSLCKTFTRKRRRHWFRQHSMTIHYKAA